MLRKLEPGSFLRSYTERTNENHQRRGEKLSNHDRRIEEVKWSWTVEESGEMDATVLRPRLGQCK